MIDAQRLLGEVDLHLIGEGRHERLWEVLGARVVTIDGVAGTAFTVWAPNARLIQVAGEFNGWDGGGHTMTRLGGGVWGLFVPGVGDGALYKFKVHGGRRPLARQGRPHGVPHRGAARAGVDRARVAL